MGSNICASEKWIFWLKSQQWCFEPKTSIPAGYSLFDWEMMKFDNSSISILFQILLFNMNSLIYLSMGDDSNWTTMLSLRDSSESLFLISVFNFFIKLKPLSHSEDEDGLVNTKSITDKMLPYWSPYFLFSFGQVTHKSGKLKYKNGFSI